MMNFFDCPSLGQKDMLAGPSGQATLRVLKYQSVVA